MKNIVKILAVSGLGFILTSCGAMNDPYGNNNGNNYPNNGNYPGNYPDGQVYRTSDGTIYRQGDIYRDRRGDVYQNGRIIRRGEQTGNPGILGRNGNNNVYYPTTNSRRLPPGQAKKVYGGKAKDYAPGQVKKRNRTFDNDRDLKNDDKRKYQKNDDRRFTDEEKNYKSKKAFKTRNGKRNGDKD